MPRAFLLPAILACVVVALGIAARLYSNSVWDDAYVFVRYARDFLADGAVAWNPGGQPTYGLTSLLYLLAVVPGCALLRADAAVIAAASSLVCGLLFLVALGILVWRHVRALAPATGGFGVLVVLLGLSAGAGSLAEHFVSGMDTTFTLLYVTLYILIAVEHERSPSRRTLVALGVCGGLAFWARPDLLLYAVLVPSSLLVLGRDRTSRRGALQILALTLGVAGGLVMVSWLYFGSALPLPFYAKCRRLYEDSVYEAHRGSNRLELLRYLRAYWPLLALVALRAALVLVRRARGFSPVETGLLVATLLFIGYYAGLVLQISNLYARFYYPTLPALLFLAARSAASLLEGGRRERARPRLRAWSVGGALVLTVLVATALVAQARELRERTSRFPFFVHNSAREHYMTTWIRGTWYRLDEFSDLPDDLVMAMTEFGYPAAMNPRKVIVDLTGLNDTQFAHHGFSARVLFEDRRPDVVFMPWRDYSRMIGGIYSDRTFQSEYESFGPGQLGTSMGLALLRSSKYYDQMRQIAAKRAPQRRIYR